MNSCELKPLGEITNNLDSRRIPLNEIERSIRRGAGKYPYFGANNELDRLDEYIFDEKILCIAEDGGSWGFNQKCAYIVNEKCWVNNHAHVLTAKPNVSLEYLKYYLNRTDLNSFITGTTRGKLTRAALERIPISLPPLAEQQRIAAILDKADALREKRRQALAKLDALLQSVFLEMFGDPVTNPKGWQVHLLSEICEGKYGIKAGPFGSSLKKETYTTTGYRVYGQEQVIAGDFGVGDYYISPEKFEEMKAYSVAPGDVLMSLVGTIGKVVVVPDEIEMGIINPRLLKISPKKNILHPYFLATFLEMPSVQHDLNSVAHGGTMNILNAGLLKKVSVALPPYELQKEFYLHLVSIKNLNLKSQASANRILDLFSALQQRAFNGELFTEKAAAAIQQELFAE
jgi:type I restriction enzyme S subunit